MVAKSDPKIVKPLEKLTKKEEESLQNELVKKLNDEVQLNLTYFLLLVSSTIIATLGLLTNSSVVVIGAMLISPLFWPIAGVTVSSFTTKRQLASKSLGSLLVSLVTVLVISYLVTIVSPLSGVTSEISLRTNPTLFDLFIALASSAIGIAAIYYPRISSTAAGVAVSIALLPALCVTGIGLAFGSSAIALGSLLLFGANMGAILFAGMVTLYLLHFRPKKEAEEKRLTIGLTGSLIFLLVLAVPLSLYLNRTLKQTQLRKDLQLSLTQELSTINPAANIQDLSIAFPSLQKSDSIELVATIYVPENQRLSFQQQEHLVSALSDQAQQPVDLQLHLVEKLHLQRSGSAKPDDYTLAKQSIQENLFLLNENINIERISLDKLTSEELSGQILLKTDQATPLTVEQHQELLSLLKADLNKEIQLEIEVITTQSLPDLAQEYKVRQLLQSQLADVTLTQITLLPAEETLLISAEGTTSQPFRLSRSEKAELVAYLESELETSIELELQITRYQQF